MMLSHLTLRIKSELGALFLNTEAYYVIEVNHIQTDLMDWIGRREVMQQKLSFQKR